MKTIEIDIETYSDVDLSASGVYPYAQSDKFRLLLFGYSVDGGEVKVVDTESGEKIPEIILNALTDNSILKYAHNSQFERICMSAYLKRNIPECLRDNEFLDPEGWRCTMTWAAYMGLPLSLKGAGAILGIEEQKMDEGKGLIKFFCVPHYDKNGHEYRNKPADDIQKWNLFKQYNKRDVEAEMGIMKKLSGFPVPEFVWEEYHMSERINDRGIALDMKLVKNAIEIDNKSRAELTVKMKNMTSLENPNSVAQMKKWLSENGLETESLGKKDIQELLKTVSPELREILLLRQQLAKSSVKKYTAMKNTSGSDNRARGCFQFYGANRTGRFAGRNIQLQNLPQNHLPDLEQARELVKTGNYESLSILYDSIPDVLSQLIRTAFVPSEGNKFIVADFSAIEARVIAWLADEQWRIDAFRNGEDIYCASASKMFGVPVIKHGENGHLRQKGKVAELACGYGGSVGAMKAMGGSEIGLTDNELKQIVDDWRAASPNIVNLWWEVDRAAKKAVKEKTITETHGLKFICRSGMLFIELPSGRSLSYVKPKMGENKFGGESITYEGVGSTKKWERLESYGPKLVENIVQGIARDLLCFSMKTLSDYRIVGHVHDEVIIECPKDTSLDFVCSQMALVPEWAEGLELRADGFETMYYKKD